jgi:hypothetical protein
MRLLFSHSQRYSNKTGSRWCTSASSGPLNGSPLVGKYILNKNAATALFKLINGEEHIHDPSNRDNTPVTRRELDRCFFTIRLLIPIKLWRCCLLQRAEETWDTMWVF